MVDRLYNAVPKQFDFREGAHDRLTHYLFRYPAKFHPPIAHALIEQYTKPGNYLLDPFCGSGTLLIEGAVAGRHVIGSDIDPVAVFISSAKTHLFNISHLKKSCEKLLIRLKAHRRKDNEYEKRQFTDLSLEWFNRCVARNDLWVPEIPNLFHWFRRYVVIDLARIHKEIVQLDVPATHRKFLLFCFASIIRRASNADPVPVSGLEVTSHMKRKDELGRIINPFELFGSAVTKALVAVEEFREKAHKNAKVKVFQANAVYLASHVRSAIEIVITSPPYHNAVDYYRRHQLEMFWLGLTLTQEDRLALVPHYIGRDRIPSRHPFVLQESIVTPLARNWESMMREVSIKRANDFKHYVVAMQKSIDQIAQILPKGKYMLFVVGHSTWNGQEIPTSDLMVELCGGKFKLVDYLSYPVINRYMSYSRNNGASIDKEYVLVFRRTAMQHVETPHK